MPGRGSHSTPWGLLDRLGGILRLPEGLQFSAQILTLSLGLFSPAALLFEFFEHLMSFLLECGLCPLGQFETHPELCGFLGPALEPRGHFAQDVRDIVRVFGTAVYVGDIFLCCPQST